MKRILIPALFALQLSGQITSLPAISGAVADGKITSPGVTTGIDNTLAIQRSMLKFGPQRGVYIPANPGPGSGASVTVTISAGALATCTVVSGGSGYSNGVLAIVTGGGGLGGEITVTVVAGVVTACAHPANGSGYASTPAVAVIPKPYCYKITQLQLLDGTPLYGAGLASCLLVSGAGPGIVVVANAATNAQTLSWQLHDLTIISDGTAAAVGVRIAAPGQDAVHFDLRNLWVTGFAAANISLFHTFGGVLTNVQSYSSGCGLRLEGGYNNTTVITGGDYSLNTNGMCIGAGYSGLKVIMPVVESNANHGLYFSGLGAAFSCDGCYFENNGLAGTINLFDIYVLSQGTGGYEAPARSFSIRNSTFQETGGTKYAVFVNNIDGFEFTGNVGTLGPSKQLQSSVVLGQGTANARIAANPLFSVRNVNEQMLLPSDGAPIYMQDMSYSTDMSNAAVWSPVTATMSQDGTLLGSDQAWKMTYGGGVGPTTPSSIEYFATYSAFYGRLWGCGAWMRTNTGTATVWAGLFGTFNYTGSNTNQPYATGIGTDWKWISNTVVFDPADAGTGSGCKFVAYPNSGATAVYIARPQLWHDSLAVPGYIATATSTRYEYEGDVVNTVAAGTGITVSKTSGVGVTITNTSPASESIVTFTPTLTFGGGTTGVTYAVQRGDYIHTGKLVTARFYMQLTSKGSSTGQACISALPFTSASNISASFGAAFSYLSGVSAATGQVMGNLTGSSTAACLFEFNAVGVTALADTDFTGGAIVQGSITYHTD